MAEYPTTQSESIGTSRPATGKGARQAVEEAKEEAFERGKGIVEGQKSSISATAHRIATAIESVASDLDYDQPQFASIFRGGARALEDFSRTLRDRDSDALLRQAQDFARRQPALVLGGTIAVGFFLSRLLKSSPHQEETVASDFDRGWTEAEQTFPGAEPYTPSTP